jgi:hypothetical protein
MGLPCGQKLLLFLYLGHALDVFLGDFQFVLIAEHILPLRYIDMWVLPPMTLTGRSFP